METLESILSQEIIQKLGWTLVHFVWEGAAIALLLAAVLRLQQRSPANLRYITACIALALIVLIPALTVGLIDTSANIAPALLELSKADTSNQAITEMSQVKPLPMHAAIKTGISLKDRLIKVIEPGLPYMVFGWLVGVLGLSIWHLGGWARLQRIRRRMVKEVSERVHLRVKHLSERMGIKRAVSIMQSALVQVPAVVGHLKPIILLPAIALTGLSSEQIEAILAHELAHIKRCDYLVNILQTLVEILGFYHPAVWWISHEIRVERENCCDDLAVSISGDRFRYARTLITMEEIRGEHIGLSVAASGGSLFDRICRLADKGKRTPEKCNWAVPVLAILLMISVLVLISCQSGRTTAPAENWNSKIAKIDIDNATAASVKSVLGEPLKYIWGQEVLNKGALPNRYIMVYPGDFHVFIMNEEVVEVRFEGPSDYVFDEGLVVGSTIEDALRILGRPSQVVEGKPNGFKGNVFYKNIDGRKGHCYYARPDKHIRIWIWQDRVKAIYLTCSDYYGRYEPTLEEAKIPATSFIDERGRIVDKIDYPFTDDPEVLGGWKSVDFVRDINAFNPNRKGWAGDLFLKELFFREGGKTNWGFLWTKGLILHTVDKTASEYLVKDIGGAKYMFMEWKSGDYTIRHMKPFYYVLKKDPDMVYVESRTEDKIDYPFVDDPQVIGTWETVDFVEQIEMFKAGEKQIKSDVWLKEMIFENNGNVTFNIKEPQLFKKWTKSLVLDEKMKTASRYTIKEINDSTYMFFEWKTGDYTLRQMKPKYYVLKKRR